MDDGIGTSRVPPRGPRRHGGPVASPAGGVVGALGGVGAACSHGVLLPGNPVWPQLLVGSEVRCGSMQGEVRADKDFWIGAACKGRASSGARPVWVGGVSSQRCVSRNGEVEDQSVDASSHWVDSSSGLLDSQVSLGRPCVLPGVVGCADGPGGSRRPRFAVSQHFRSTLFSPVRPSVTFLRLPLLLLILFSLFLALSLTLSLSSVLSFFLPSVCYPHKKRKTKYHEIGRGAS